MHAKRKNGGERSLKFGFYCLKPRKDGIFKESWNYLMKKVFEIQILKVQNHKEKKSDQDEGTVCQGASIGVKPGSVLETVPLVVAAIAKSLLLEYCKPEP